MRTLNRPMFRYGGPIKEGVMSGIREPKKDGGSMSESQGKNLVGDPVYPKTGGREHHFAFGGLGVGALAAIARFAPAAYRGFKAARAYAPWSQKLGVAGRLKNILMPKGGLKAPMAPTGAGAGFRVGSFLRQNPITSLSVAPQAAALGYAGAKGGLKAAPGIAKGYADMLWPGDSLFKDKSPEEKKEIQKQIGAAGGPPGGGDPDMKGDGSYDAKQANIAKQKEWNNRIKKYRDIMDIKGMNKQAAYKSLVDASKLIQESGDFKGDIKSGKLINQVIQAASKQFDKPAKTSDAINSLILQNELKKDLNKEENALAKTLTQKKILLADKQLAGTTLNEEISAYRNKHGKNPTATKLEGILLDKNIPVEAVADTVQVDAHIKNGGDEVSFMESIVEANTEQGKPVTPGVYVVKDKIIVIDENGNVKKKR